MACNNVNSKNTPNHPLGDTLALPKWQRLSHVIFELVGRIESRRGMIAAAFVVALLCELISFLIATSWDATWASRFTVLAETPFAKGPIAIPYPEHRLRLLGPVVAWALQLHGLPSTFVPIAANIPLLMIVYTVIRRRTDLRIAVVMTLLMSLTHLTMTSRVLLGYHDSMVFLCVLIAMVSRHWWTSAIAMFLALYGDPRAIEVVPFLLAWHIVDQEPDRPVHCFIVRGLTYTLVLILWIISAHYFIRLFGYDSQLQSRLDLYLSGKFLDDVNLGYIQLSTSMTFKAAWIFPVILCWLWLGRRPLLAVMILLTLAIIACSSLMVHDYSRALTFCFPLVILGIVELWKVKPRVCLPVGGTCLLVNITTPFYHGQTKGLWVLSYPLPADLVRLLFMSESP